jgi:hypothetical protein
MLKLDRTVQPCKGKNRKAPNLKISEPQGEEKKREVAAPRDAGTKNPQGMIGKATGVNEKGKPASSNPTTITVP